VIRENPASRGTEASAEELVGPPLGAGGWSRTPVNSSGTREEEEEEEEEVFFFFSRHDVSK
jgi:hypothetical protein